MAGGLRRDSEPPLAGVVHDGDDVALVDREGDGFRVQVDRQIEGLAGGIPVAVTGDDRAAGHDVGEWGGCGKHVRSFGSMSASSIDHREPGHISANPSRLPQGFGGLAALGYG